MIVPDLGHLSHVACLAGASPATVARYLRSRLIVASPEPGPAVPMVDQVVIARDHSARIYGERKRNLV